MITLVSHCPILCLSFVPALTNVLDMVLEDVTEFDYSGSPVKLSKILLNGNNICMVLAAHAGIHDVHG